MPSSDNGTPTIKFRFSDFFGIDPSLLMNYGAFDISLVADLPLFIDPFHLFNSDNPDYQHLHAAILKYLAFLRDHTGAAKLDSGLVKAWYTFPEIPQTWLGFTVSGNSGRGLGSKFAKSLHKNLGILFDNVGVNGITASAHLEKLCLIERGVGRDNVSDLTTNLIKEYLLDYTQTIALKSLKMHNCREFAIPKVRFNYETESWESRSFVLPAFEDSFVLLTPRNLLTKDNPWINKQELIDRIESIPDAIPDAALRAQINNYFSKALAKDPDSEDRVEAAIATLHQFPVLIDYYIRQKENDRKYAQASSSEKVRDSEQLYLTQFGELANLLGSESAFYQIRGDTCGEARERIQFLKDVIENKGGHKLFYLRGKPIQREEDVHVAFRLTWFGTSSDVSREVNDGRGPTDFKISKGSKNKAIVEFKLAKNTQLKKNLQKQTDVYKKASDAKCAIKVIIFFNDKELKRVNNILKELKMREDKDLVLIDARINNKPSGSKAA